VISTIKKYILESFSESTSVSDVMKIGWKSVSGMGRRLVAFSEVEAEWWRGVVVASLV